MSKSTVLPAADVIKSLTDVLRADREINAGYDRADSAMYTLGYLESSFARAVEGLPAKYRAEIINDLISTVTMYTGRLSRKETV